MEIGKDKLKNFLTSVKDKTSITAQELIEKDFRGAQDFANLDTSIILYNLYHISLS